jgi:ATP-dependent DNA ligase
MGCGAIRLVKTTTATSIEEVDRFPDEFVAAGYEGAILRVPDAPYAMGARSAALLTYKRFDELRHIAGSEAIRARCPRPVGSSRESTPRNPSRGP